MTLKEAGITSINLNYTEKNSDNEINDSVLANISSVTFEDGTETTVGNLNFLQTVLILRITLNLR